MTKKQMTIDDLGVMVQKGFRDVEERMATKDMLKAVVDGMDIMRADIRDIKITLGPLVYAWWLRWTRTWSILPHG
ncbi:MAG: hypothetical protein Q8R40_06500 [bacterium]|nr:hypothetical protein [bacterium]